MTRLVDDESQKPVTGQRASDPSAQAATEQTVLVEITDAVATVTLNRPERLNALTPQMRVAYMDMLRKLDRDPEVRVIVVTGAGRGFCSGADTSVLTAGNDGLAAYAARPENVPTMALELRKPLVAAVNGAVAGIGFAIMLAADVRFVARDAKISSTFARLGLVAEYGSAWMLPRIIGMGRAAEILLSGRSFDGVEAERLGLAVEAVDADQVLARAQDWAHQVARSCAPWSLEQMKRQLYHDSVLPSGEAVVRSLELMLESFDRPDLGEALRARAEKRPPRFPTE
jgi:enoyl-CoA hydratase/carnithine racemase